MTAKVQLGSFVAACALMATGASMASGAAQVWTYGPTYLSDFTQPAVKPIIDLSAEGKLDWIHFGGPDDTGGNNANDTRYEHKSDGAGGAVGLISNFTYAGNRNSFPNDPLDLKWDNGTGVDQALVSVNSSGSDNGTPNATSRAVFGMNTSTLTVVGDPNEDRRFRLYAGFSSGTDNTIRWHGDIDVSMPGIAPFSVPQFQPNGPDGTNLYYDFIFRTASPGDVLTLTYRTYFTDPFVMANGSYMVAGTLAAVPEPGTVMAGVALCGMLAIRRARRWA